jgi:hypothetical protein
MTAIAVRPCAPVGDLNGDGVIGAADLSTRCVAGRSGRRLIASATFERIALWIKPAKPYYFVDSSISD